AAPEGGSAPAKPVDPFVPAPAVEVVPDDRAGERVREPGALEILVAEQRVAADARRAARLQGRRDAARSDGVVHEGVARAALQDVVARVAVERVAAARA